MTSFLIEFAYVIAALIAWFLFLYVSVALAGRAWHTEKRISMQIWNEEVNTVCVCHDREDDHV